MIKHKRPKQIPARDPDIPALKLAKRRTEKANFSLILNIDDSGLVTRPLIVLERTSKSLAASLPFFKLDNLQFYENASINPQCFCFLCQKSVKSAKTKA